jgi:hypothetical protein
MTIFAIHEQPIFHQVIMIFIHRLYEFWEMTTNFSANLLAASFTCLISFQFLPQSPITVIFAKQHFSPACSQSFDQCALVFIELANDSPQRGDPF